MKITVLFFPETKINSKVSITDILTKSLSQIVKKHKADVLVKSAIVSNYEELTLEIKTLQTLAEYLKIMQDITCLTSTTLLNTRISNGDFNLGIGLKDIQDNTLGGEK